MASGAARGELVRSAAVAAADQFPPAPPTQVRAADRPGDAGGAVVIRWVPSPDDLRRLVGQGAASFAVHVGPGVVHPVQGLFGYRILRWCEGEVPGLLASVRPGVAEYVDTTAIDGLRYRYEVRAFDGAGESAAPVEAEGRPILGWFDRADPTVDLNDFFLFADHFGRVEGEAVYDPLYDLDGDGRVDFDDFFLFADNYGRQVANLPAGP